MALRHAQCPIRRRVAAVSANSRVRSKLWLTLAPPRFPFAASRFLTGVISHTPLSPSASFLNTRFGKSRQLQPRSPFSPWISWIVPSTEKEIP